MIARQAEYRDEQLRKLSPEYWDCPEDCDHGDACKVKPIEDAYQRKCKEEIAEIDGSAQYTFEIMERQYFDACALDARAGGKRYMREWTETTTAFINILRAERNRKLNIERWERDQEK